MNATSVAALPAIPAEFPDSAYQYIPLSQPFYYSSSPALSPYLSDVHLSLAMPIIAYWGYSLFWHALDQTDILARYRLHEPAEVTSRNRASMNQVVYAVLAQHVVQTLLGLAVLDDSRYANVPQDLALLGMSYGPSIGKHGVYYLYWWLFPLVRVLFATCVLSLFFVLCHELA